MPDPIPLVRTRSSDKTTKHRAPPLPVRRAHGVHQLFEAQVERTPDTCAVASRDRCLTYRELNEQANHVARDLITLGIKPDSLVGLCIERSAQMLVAMLAVLKTGAAYVPLDPSYPEGRLSAILCDAEPRALVTQRNLAARFAEPSQPLVVLDSDGYSSPGALSSNLSVPLTPENLAYVIYTSGSTGNPKGVLVTHRSLINHNLAMAKYYELRPEDRVLQFATFTFDVAAEEIYPTWLSGAAVVLWPVTTGTAPIRRFLEFVEEQQITVLNLPAAYWHEWVCELDRRAFPESVRLVIVGSDKVSAEKFNIWKRRVGDRVRLCNAYGPTEATITATVFEPPSDWQPESVEWLPIGKPIANTEAWVLDENKKPVPAGQPGELFIGGAGLARGYLNQPDLTREKFLENPFRDGERLYRTGDLARLLSDGNLEFLGRTDDQVKIRGFRIEIGEIENALRQFPKARDAVVLAREDIPGEKRLVGYLAIATADRPTIEALKKFLGARLPEYMVPVDFVMLRHFPLTAGGKIDRRNLPRPELNREDSGKAYVAPRSDLECKLVEIWEAMLGVKPIGIRDNFFELGGHSLMEVRLVGEIEKKLGLTLPLTALYYTRTVERLAIMLEQRGGSNPLVIPGRTEGSRTPIFSHGGSTRLAENLGDDQPIYWLQAYGGDGSRVAGSIEEAAAHYLREIRQIQPQGPYYLMGYCLGALMSFEIAQQLVRQGEKVALLALIDPAIPTLRQTDAQNSAAKEPANLSSKLSGFYRRLIGLLELKKLPTKLRARIRWAGRISRRWLSERWLDSGRRLPLFLRDFYLVETGEELIQRYVPKYYAGPAVVFRSLADGTEEEWRRVIPNGEFHNTWVDHNEFLEEPYVETLVAEIKSHLKRAGTMVPVAAPKGSMTQGLYSRSNPTQSQIDDG